MEGIYRIIDANLNRLREGLRVVEEYYRFYCEDSQRATELKELRHKVIAIESTLSQDALLNARDSEDDPFNAGMLGKEGERESLISLLLANIRRAQEAARVLEEYIKLLPETQDGAEIAKGIRFALYTIEKKQVIYGKEKHC